MFLTVDWIATWSICLTLEREEEEEEEKKKKKKKKKEGGLIAQSKEQLQWVEQSSFLPLCESSWMIS